MSNSIVDEPMDPMSSLVEHDVDVMGLLLEAQADETVANGAPTDAERYRDILRDDRYRAAIALVEGYPWPALADAVRRAYQGSRSGVEKGMPGSVRLGGTEWWVDPRDGSVYPFVTELALCEDCLGEARWSEEIADARKSGALDMYAHGECPACQGRGEVEDLVALHDAWDGNQFFVADDPLSTAMQLIVHHWMHLPEVMRNSLELKLPALERPAEFQGSGS